MFSIYTSGFNLVKGKFAWQDALNSFAQFADEVVIALNTSEDGSVALVEEYVALTKGRHNIIVVKTDIPYTDPDLDGKVKNAALQATTQEFKIGLDLDERLPLWQKPLWEQYAFALSQQPEAGSIMIPVVNLYKDDKHVRDVSSKWYLHKHGLYRGVVKFARNPDGTHDITKSDSCELINSDGDLVLAMSSLPQGVPTEHMLTVLATEKYPFVVHYGYVDLERRIEINRNFWKNHWSIEAGHPVDVPTEVSVIDKEHPFPHDLKIHD